MILENIAKGKRVDLLLSEYLKEEKCLLSRTFIKDNWEGLLKVNGSEVKPSYKTREGDIVEINMDKITELSSSLSHSVGIKGQEYNLEILFEDKDFLVVNKAKGVVVHPGIGNTENTLSNYVKGYLELKGEFDEAVTRAGIVHRLDKGVSGLIVFAKNAQAQIHLQEQFQSHTVRKIYLAEIEYKQLSSDFKKYFSQKEKSVESVVEDLERKEFVFDDTWYKAEGYIRRSSRNRVKMEFKKYQSGNSKYALSYIKPISENQCLIYIKTGRMHQIRATLESLGVNIVGDTLYKGCGGSSMPEEIALESVYLAFKDINGEEISISKF